MYTEKFVYYYDILHSQKNYNDECELILKNSNNFSKLLDVGCGTLGHGIILSKKYDSVLGVDLSEEMISISKNKIKTLELHNVQVYCSQLGNISFSNSFDTIISMFYVVNHIETLSELQKFFYDVIKLLKEDGVFIFDCWNGTACRIDKPKPESEKTIVKNPYTIILKTKTETNLLESISVINTSVKINMDSHSIDEFTYTLRQKLWTPDIFFDILKCVGFEKIEIIPYYKQNELVKETDYKLTFICKKK